jgi:hypothetical protein
MSALAAPASRVCFNAGLRSSNSFAPGAAGNMLLMVSPISTGDAHAPYQAGARQDDALAIVGMSNMPRSLAGRG